MQSRCNDQFIVAASSLYVHAVEDDLCAGRAELASLKQLTIVISKGYQGRLGNNIALSSAAMMYELKTNISGLSTSHALKILVNYPDKYVPDGSA